MPQPIREKHFTVVSDTGCGAASVTTPFLLRKLGCKVITLNAQVDGTFPGRNPEPTGNEINDLKAAVEAAGANLGVAHDADADRAVFIDDKGRFVNEDVLLALMTQYKLQQKPGSIVVTPVSSSSLIEDIAQQIRLEGHLDHGGQHPRGPEDDGGRRRLRRRGQRRPDLPRVPVLPGRRHVRGQPCWRCLRRPGKKLSDIVDALPSYSSVKEKIKCKDKDAVLKSIENEIRQEKAKADLTDGIKVFRPEGWVLIRASGTEPIIRVFAESRTDAGAKKLADYGVGLVNRFNKLTTRLLFIFGSTIAR